MTKSSPDFEKGIEPSHSAFRIPFPLQETATADLIDDLFYMERSGLENQYASAVDAPPNQQGFSAGLSKSADEQLSEKLDQLISAFYPQSDLEHTPPDESSVDVRATEIDPSREHSEPTANVHRAGFHFPPQSLVTTSAVRTITNDASTTLEGDEQESSPATRALPKALQPGMVTVPEGLYFFPSDLLCLPNTDPTQLLSHIISCRVPNENEMNVTVPDGAPVEDEAEAASSQSPPRKRVKHAPKLKESIAARSNVDYKPSSHCHICGRKENTDFAICLNFMIQACKKVLCTKCVMIYENEPCGPTGPVLDGETYPRHMLSARACPHCRNTCPERAKCNRNKAMNKLQS